MEDVLQQLDKIIAQRRSAEPDASYVASLNAAGLNRILEKVGEECVETILAARDCADGKGKQQLVSETASWIPSTLANVISGVDNTASVGAAIVAIVMWALVPAAIGLVAVTRRDVA